MEDWTGIQAAVKHSVNCQRKDSKLSQDLKNSRENSYRYNGETWDPLYREDNMISMSVKKDYVQQ